MFFIDHLADVCDLLLSVFVPDSWRASTPSVAGGTDGTCFICRWCREPKNCKGGVECFWPSHEDQSAGMGLKVFVKTGCWTGGSVVPPQWTRMISVINHSNCRGLKPPTWWTLMYNSNWLLHLPAGWSCCTLRPSNSLNLQLLSHLHYSVCKRFNSSLSLLFEMHVIQLEARLNLLRSNQPVGCCFICPWQLNLTRSLRWWCFNWED